MFRLMKLGWVYITTNAPFGTLYIGVTANLAARVNRHRRGRGSAFCKKHGFTRLVYVEEYEQITMPSLARKQ